MMLSTQQIISKIKKISLIDQLIAIALRHPISNTRINLPFLKQQLLLMLFLQLARRSTLSSPVASRKVLRYKVQVKRSSSESFSKRRRTENEVSNCHNHSISKPISFGSSRNRLRNSCIRSNSSSILFSRKCIISNCSNSSSFSSNRNILRLCNNCIGIMIQSRTKYQRNNYSNKSKSISRNRLTITTIIILPALRNGSSLGARIMVDHRRRSKLLSTFTRNNGNSRTSNKISSKSN